MNENNFIIIFPSIFGEISSPWKEEYEYAKSININVSLFDEEELTIKSNLDNKLVIYRGWMISVEKYEEITKMVENKKGKMLIPVDHYKKANYISSWYNIIQRETITSKVFKNEEELKDLFIHGKSFFIKDELKSLGQYNSIAHSFDEAIQIYNKIQEKRDFVINNNSYILRDVISMNDEERFFVFNGKILNPPTKVQDFKFVSNVVEKLIKRGFSFFYSLDIAQYENKPIVVEIGGFQVSDIKNNSLESFYKILKEEIERYP